MTSTAPSTKRLESSTPSETAIRWPTTELLLSGVTGCANVWRRAALANAPMKAPSVGIFWAVPDDRGQPTLVLDRTSVAEAEPSGDCLNHPRGHYEVLVGQPERIHSRLPQEL